MGSALPALAPRGRGYWAILISQDAEGPALEHQLRQALGRIAPEAPQGHTISRVSPAPPQPGHVHVIDDPLAYPLRGSVVLVPETFEADGSRLAQAYLPTLHNGGLADVRTLSPGGRLGYVPGCEPSPFGGVAEADAGWPGCPLRDLLESALIALRAALDSDLPERAVAIADRACREWQDRARPRPGDPLWARWWHLGWKPMCALWDPSLALSPSELRQRVDALRWALALADIAHRDLHHGYQPRLGDPLVA